MGIHDVYGVLATEAKVTLASLAKYLGDICRPRVVGVDANVAMWGELHSMGRTPDIFGRTSDIAAAVFQRWVLPLLRQKLSVVLVLDGHAPPTKVASARRKKARDEAAKLYADLCALRISAEHSSADLETLRELCGLSTSGPLTSEDQEIIVRETKAAAKAMTGLSPHIIQHLRSLTEETNKILQPGLSVTMDTGAPWEVSMREVREAGDERSEGEAWTEVWG